MIRLFVGVALPESISARLTGLASGLPGARWIAPENMHVTLHFIGDIDETQAEDLDDALGLIDAPGFELSLGDLGAFNRRQRVTAVWAGVEKNPALEFLFERVESLVVRAGFPPEGRKFSPHVTIARFSKSSAPRAMAVARYLESHAGFKAGPFRVDALVLFRSHLGSGGAHYEAVTRYPLAVGLNADHCR